MNFERGQVVMIDTTSVNKVGTVRFVDMKSRKVIVDFPHFLTGKTLSPDFLIILQESHKNFWTEEEEKILMNNLDLPNKMLAYLVNKSEKAVSMFKTRNDLKKTR